MPPVFGLSGAVLRVRVATLRVAGVAVVGAAIHERKQSISRVHAQTTGLVRGAASELSALATSAQLDCLLL